MTTLSAARLRSSHFPTRTASAALVSSYKFLYRSVMSLDDDIHIYTMNSVIRDNRGLQPKFRIHVKNCGAQNGAWDVSGVCRQQHSFYSQFRRGGTSDSLTTGTLGRAKGSSEIIITNKQHSLFVADRMPFLSPNQQ